MNYRKILLFVLAIFFSLFFVANENVANAQKDDFFKDVLYYKKPKSANSLSLLKTHYDYTNVARSITKGCKTDYDKVRAIYKWMCDNIEYDTSYKIHDADNCFDNRKGVCQAYCNLFYYMAKSIGIKVEIISGISKDSYGNIGSTGHSWLFAYVEDNYGILLDPTWGAGGVSNGKFVKDDNCWVWFNVDPKWMILSHFPDDESCQILENPISKQKFYSLSPVNSLWLEFGIDPEDIYYKNINYQLEMPEFYTTNEGKIELIDFPMQKSLKIGQFYTFRVKMLCDNELAIINGDDFFETEQWEEEGNGVYSISFMPRNTEGVRVSVIDDDEGMWWSVIEYKIDQPTQRDWNNLKNIYPMESPEVADIENLNVKEWKSAGVNEYNLYQLITSNNVKELPIFYSNMGQNLKIVNVPMTKNLKKGNTYTFSFYPRKGEKWAIINEGSWYTEWNISSDGKYTITVTPEGCGKLSLSVLRDDGLYYSCLGYKVTY